MLRSTTFLDNSNDKSSPKPDDHSFLKAQRWAIISPGPSSSLCRELRTLCPTSSALWYFKSWNLIARLADGPLKCPLFLFSFKANRQLENSLLHIAEKFSKYRIHPRRPPQTYIVAFAADKNIKQLLFFFFFKSNTNATCLKTNPKVFFACSCSSKK